MDEPIQRSSEAFAAPLDDSVLLLNAETGRYHGLNPVAARIWDLLAEPITQDALIAKLLTEFDVSPEECRDQVSAFLGDLRERGLLKQG